MNDQTSAEVNVGVERPTVVAEERGAERAAIAGRAGLVGAGTLVSRVLGLGRDLVLAAMFPRALTDLFFVAFTIPNALRQLLAEGALSSAFVPVLAKIETDEGPKEAARFYARLRGLMWIVLIATCAIGVMAAPLLCELFAAGFHARPGAFERTVAVTRAVFPYLLFMGLAALGAGALQVRKKFGVAAFAPALLNVGMILGAVVLAPILVAHGTDPLFALAIGALVGGALQVWAQMPDLKRAGFTEPLAIDLNDPKLRLVLARIAPMTIGLMIYEIDLVLSRRFLSEAGEGANSWFYYAQRLCDFPQGIFSLALATATLPSLAKLVAKGDREEVARTFAHALRLALWVALPATAILVALARPLVIAFFARGKFDAASIDGTTAALIVQGLGVFVVAIVRQVVPLYYALGDTKTPVWISGVDLVAFIAIALLLRGPIGHVGVSAAVTGSSIVQMLLLVVWVKKPLPELRASMVLPSAAKSALAAIVAGVVAFAVAWSARPLGHVRAIGGLLPAVAGCSAFAVVYLAIGRAIGQEEQAQLVAGLRRRLRRRAAG
jgi:putative peptidoglycan lipid II flippase